MVDPPPTIVIQAGLAVYRFGAGAPVLFMPGPHRFQQPGMLVADALIDGLVRLGRQVITFDPPDSGRSTRPARLSLVEMHSCADEALAVAGVDGPVDMLGHSMGGLVTLAYAIEQPRRAKRLVLVGTGTGGRAYRAAPGALWNRSHPAFWRMAVLGLLHLAWPRRATETIMMNFIARQSYHDPTLAQPKPITWRDWLGPRAGRTDWQDVARRLDYAPRLGEITAPTLILCGRHDPQYPLSASQELAAGIPHAWLVVFGRSGHYPFIEQADDFWAAVAAFWNE